jgi:hypothetical protein
MSTAYSIPIVQAETDNTGTHLPFALTLNLPTTTPLTGGAVTWALSANVGGHAGTLTPSNDGQSALYTVNSAGVSTDHETVTATTKTAAAGVCGSWQPGRLYRLGDKIVDQNGYLQTVTSAARLLPLPYTPEHNSIPSFVTGWNQAAPNEDVGDGGWFEAISDAKLVSAAALAVFSIDPNGLNFILNQGDGDINGDWPLGATLPAGADTNQQGPATGYHLNSAGAIVAGPSPIPTTAALVTVLAAGFSSGANYIAYPGATEAGTSAGIDSPVPTVLTLTAVAASSGGVAVYTGTIAANATIAAGLVGLTFVVSGFIVAADNGTFLCTAASTTTLTLQNASATAQTHAGSAYALVPTDLRIKNASYSERGAGALGTFVLTGVTTTVAGSGVAVYAGTITGGATPANNAFAGYAFTVAGYVTYPKNNGVFLCTASTGSTLTLANASATTESIASTATNTGVRAYLDAQGNAHVGWQIAEGTQNFSEAVAIPPNFSTTGSAYTNDNELIWQNGGLAATASSVATVLTLATGASIPLGYSALLG